ncbi:MAG: hypothetical protein J5I91_02060 [Bacteroidetes bacterium]|nr:hypothetical protein [Bacteroidota bacterium]
MGQVRIGGISQTSKDSSAKKKKPVEDIARIDPFYSVNNEVEAAGLRYDSLEWNFEGVQNYHPMYKQYFNVQSLGDVGLPAIPYLINREISSGFVPGLYLYNGYLYRNDNSPYLRAFTPFTRLQYVQTKKEYVHLQGLHTQNITPGWNIALRFQTINNMGFYPNQKNSLRQIGFSSRYMDLSNRYYAQVSLNYNRMRMQVNGGWANELNFDTLRGVNKSAEVRLNNSSNYFGNREYTLEQVYWFAGNYIKTSDTTRYFKPLLGIKHRSSFEKTFNVFESQGADLALFPAIYLDSAQTHDSSAFAMQTHTLGITNYITDTSHFHFYAGVGAEILKVQYLNFGKYHPGNNLFADANFRWKLLSGMILQATGRSFFAGYNSGDFLLKGRLSYSLLKTEHIKKRARLPLEQIYTQLTIQNREPNYILSNFASNNTKWENNFSKEHIACFEGGISGYLKTGDWALKIVNTTIANPVFVGFGAVPEQIHAVVNQTEFWILANFKLGKFHLNNHVIYQTPGNNVQKEIMPTPALSTYNSLFYQNDLFKKALKLQLGVDFRWYSAFYANAYDPVTRLFFLQNRRKQGNYPMIDIFAAAEVKTFRLFVKMEHSNYELWNNSFSNLYYSTPGYSLTPRRLAFGIQWKFYK